MSPERKKLGRRDLLKLGLTAGAAAAVGGSAFAPRRTEAKLYIDDMPTSPLILDPFTEPLPIPKALRPVTDGSVRFDPYNHDSVGGRPHQVIPSQLGLPDPIIYHLQLRVGQHSFTSSRVLPIDEDGDKLKKLPKGAKATLAKDGTAKLPPSTIYGFSVKNAKGEWECGFPGARINAEYGKPCMVRFENRLDENPGNYPRQDFGAPMSGYHDRGPGPRFLTHLHNGHTAPESDGNPHYRPEGYYPGQYSDNLYLNYPAGGDDREKQSFMWFHDHQHSHTGANVYKGMVGLFPIYDPKNALDAGDERQGLRLPGVRTNHPDGSFDVEYDIPLALYDVALDDGVTKHKDAHTGNGETHPEWWGMQYFRHLPNKGFVGDIFTVNCKAFPYLEVKRRKYRFRFLDASIARCYELMLMSSRRGPRAARDLGFKDEELQGQYRLPDGQQCMKMTQIASEGGLLPFPIVRNSIEIWPAKRREVIVDFTRYMDGTPTTKGDVIYLVNVLAMYDGRKPEAGTRFGGIDSEFKVPILKIIIGDNAPDYSVMPSPTTLLRAPPPLPSPDRIKELMKTRRVFKLERGSDPFNEENEWLINGRPFNEHVPLAFPKKGSEEIWEIENGGGGWVHPMHIHQEEHLVIARNGVPVPLKSHPDDVGKEDVVALDPGESVMIYRKFRMFTGAYVAHCHNLAHEDHAMMFGWKIV